MYSATLPFHGLSPIALQLGPLEIRWYSLAYIVGLLLAWYVAKRMVRSNKASTITEVHLDDLVGLAAIGVIVGGRLGYVLFYNFAYYMKNPLGIVQVWDGGMSFHGGMIGVVLSICWFTWRNKLNFRAVGDIVATVCGFGLLFGRLANFINGELYGRVSNLPWAMEFPGAVGARHPSQLYEAILEGLIVTGICLWLMSKPKVRAHAGFTGGVFFVGYGISRIIVEFFRQPDAHIGTGGFMSGWLTMGMLLSVPMILFGLFAMAWSRKAEPIKVTGYNAD